MADSTAISTPDPGLPQKAAPPPATLPAETGGGNWWGNFRNYLGETRNELRKVTWPTKDAWVNSSIITLLTILTIALVMAGLNAIFAFVAGQFFG
ncbi:MAG TPA: preprotein translocase subunit SecE [bacterium]|nr:preprotein translocase subunit SecE [bacterium]